MDLLLPRQESQYLYRDKGHRRSYVLGVSDFHLD